MGPTAVAKALELGPNVVILDLSLPGEMNGFDTAIEMRRVAPSTKIILFSLRRGRLVQTHSFQRRPARASYSR
jgi:DNA-binding NarL/FixJ family response regulator